MTVRDVIRFAYAVQPFQIEGGPSWIDSERFDVLAKVEGEIPLLPPGQVGPVQVMTQNLLAERFKLKVRRETKDAPVYALVLARADKQLGKQIEPSTVDCVALLKAMMAGGRGGPPGARRWPTVSSLGSGARHRIGPRRLDSAAGPVAVGAAAAAGGGPHGIDGRVFVRPGVRD